MLHHACGTKEKYKTTAIKNLEPFGVERGGLRKKVGL